MPLSHGQFESLRAGVLRDLGLFAPELIVAGAIALVLALRLFKLFDRVHLGTVAVIPLAGALWLLLGSWHPGFTGSAFGGLLQLDTFSVFVRGFLLVFAILALLLGKLTNIPDAEDSADYILLLLGGTLGMMVMASANHLLMVFIGMEMASLPSYALAGFLKGRRTGSEAALKYVLYGSAASGIALYGISLLAVTFGTLSLSELAAAFAAGKIDTLAAAGLLFLFVGFAFKLSAVPFHFWCPDVFEGAVAEVGAFLSVASKGAAVALTARVAMTLHVPEIGTALMILAGLTATFGNFAALAQTNVQRMLAYSTIAHAGYMLMGLCVLNAKGVSAVLYYLAAYLPANLAAFAVVAFVRNGRTPVADAPGSQGLTLNDLRGLMKRSPVLAFALVVALLSLLGLPPLGGFAGKFQVFEAVYAAGRHSETAWAFNALLAVGVLNTVVSAGYYLRVVRLVVLEEPEGNEPLRTPAGAGFFVALLSLAIVALGMVWNPLERLASLAARSL
jgi:NADH-quinone oxidoreductase subunit N